MLMVTTVKEYPGLIVNSYPEFLQQYKPMDLLRQQSCTRKNKYSSSLTEEISVTGVSNHWVYNTIPAH